MSAKFTVYRKKKRAQKYKSRKNKSLLKFKTHPPNSNPQIFQKIPSSFLIY